jgi:hypothetical protein
MVVLVALQDYGVNIAKVGVKKLASIVLLILTFSPSVRSTRLHTLFLSRAFLQRGKLDGTWVRSLHCVWRYFQTTYSIHRLYVVKPGHVGTFIFTVKSVSKSRLQRFPNSGRAPWGSVGPLWGGGASSLYQEHVYFERNMGVRQNIYFGRHFAWLKYEACFVL